VTNPRTLFVGEKKLQESIKLLQQFENGTLPQGTTDQRVNKIILVLHNLFMNLICSSSNWKARSVCRIVGVKT